MKGILMTPDMIQAIVEGRKTQTRRVIKPQPDSGLPEFDRYSHITVGWYHPTKINRYGEGYPGDEVFGAYTDDGVWGWRCPYHVGEAVYIKEPYYIIGTFRVDHIGFDDQVQIKYSPDGAITWVRKPRNKPIHVIGYHSPLLMPEWAARHFITILAVRAERLQEITPRDCEAEGVDGRGMLDCYILNDFRIVWDSINPRYPFESNPWVFPYEFEFVKER